MFQNGIDKNRLDFIRLREAKAISHFDCGDADLNDFILNRASAYQRQKLAVSYACVDSNDASKVYAYCSLANDKVALDDFKDKTEFNRFRKKRGFPNEKRLKSYPAVKLCRLGVENSVKGKQIGTTVIDFIKSMSALDSNAGCRFLTVDANLNAVPFYEKNGFVRMNAKDDNPHTRLMYFDLNDIAEDPV
ncbi:MAG: GNAT family N-acetyltransferase [Fibrobacter sp.]|nr:GNAT family N-acetyltransferase [Fibrobacter sp.]